MVKHSPSACPVCQATLFLVWDGDKGGCLCCGSSLYSVPAKQLVLAAQHLGAYKPGKGPFRGVSAEHLAALADQHSRATTGEPLNA